jgi:hypothetical protein
VDSGCDPVGFAGTIDLIGPRYQFGHGNRRRPLQLYARRSRCSGSGNDPKRNNPSGDYLHGPILLGRYSGSDTVQKL